MKVMTAYPEFTEFENRLVTSLADRLARYFGLTYQDKEDIRQELATFLWIQKSNYDPDHISGSRYETYITKCLERKSHEIVRAVCPDVLADYEEDVDACGNIERSKSIYGLPPESYALLNVLAEKAIDRLSPEQWKTLEQLKEGKGVRQIARESGLPHTTVQYRVRRIREIFRKYGFELSLKRNQRKEGCGHE